MSVHVCVCVSLACTHEMGRGAVTAAAATITKQTNANEAVREFQAHTLALSLLLFGRESLLVLSLSFSALLSVRLCHIALCCWLRCVVKFSHNGNVVASCLRASCNLSCVPVSVLRTRRTSEARIEVKQAKSCQRGFTQRTKRQTNQQQKEKKTTRAMPK